MTVKGSKGIGLLGSSSSEDKKRPQRISRSATERSASSLYH
jgi:hypothetical protein